MKAAIVLVLIAVVVSSNDDAKLTIARLKLIGAHNKLKYTEIHFPPLQQRYSAYCKYQLRKGAANCDPKCPGASTTASVADGHVLQRAIVTPKYSTRADGKQLWLALLNAARAWPAPANTNAVPFKTRYRWKQIDFEFPSIMHRHFALSTGKYIPSNVLPLGLEVWGRRVWVTLPNWRRGVPATLATLPRVGGLASPSLKPYPDWSFHRAFDESSNCSVLTSVFRVNTDPCGRLWVLDSGIIDSQDDPKQLCPPSLFVFNLSTDKLIARYPITDKFVLQDSLFTNIIVDTRTDDCSDLHVYIADTWRFGLLVFRENDQTFWRYSSPLFYPDPLASNYTLHGLNFQWADGIFGLALTPLGMQSDERILLFNSLSSFRVFSVRTSYLRDPSRVNNSATEFKIIGESRGLRGQASASAIDSKGVMFYGLVSRDSIGCWDTRKPYTLATTGVVASDPKILVYPNDLKVDKEDPENIWIISNRLPMFQAGILNPDDYNYRILSANTGEIVQRTVCNPEVQLQ